VTESFGGAIYLSAIYADRFDSYDGQKLQVNRRAARRRGPGFSCGRKRFAVSPVLPLDSGWNTSPVIRPGPRGHR